jgi:hypothetical protein
MGARQNLAPNVIILIPTNKGSKMRNRYRIEIYDEVKANDLTLYSEQGVDKEHLTEIVFSNLRRFEGNVKAFVYDNLKKKKTTALFLPMEVIPKKTQLTNLLG